MKRVGRIAVGILGSMVIAVLVLAIVTRITPLPISPVARLIEFGVQRSLGISMTINGARLGWSSTSDMFALKANSIDVVDSDDARLSLGASYASLSGEALWGYGKLAVAEVEIERLAVVLSKTKRLPPSFDFFVPTFGQQAGKTAPNFLKKMAIREIIIGEPLANKARKSQLLLTHYGDHINLNTNIAYQQDGQLSSLLAVLKLTPGQKGHADIILENMNPRDLGRVSTLLAPLQGIHLPITAQLAVNFNGKAEAQTGSIELFVAPGELVLSGTPVAFKELTISGTADFRQQQVLLRDARFNVADVAGTISGALNYTLDELGNMSQLVFNLDGRGVQANLPKLFEQTLVLPRAKAKLSYDLATGQLNIRQFKAEHNFGEVALAGAIGLANRDVYFDFVTEFGRLDLDGALALWPVPIAPRVKQWVRQNLLDAQVVDGSLKLDVGLAELTRRKRTDPLREEALQMNLQVEQSSLRFLNQLPPVEDFQANMRLGGTSFRVDAQGGVMHLPTLTDGVDKGGTRAAVMQATRFFIADMRDPKLAGDVEFTATGEIRDVIRALNAKPLAIVKDIDFDFDRIRGDANAKVRLSVPLGAKVNMDDFTYQVEATTMDVSIDEALGPYTITAARGMADISNSGMLLMGRAKANGVAAGFSWDQPFGENAEARSRFSAHTSVTPQDLVDLDQAWVGERATGSAAANILVLGPMETPSQIRLYADLTQTELLPRPLAYTKPIGVVSDVHAVMGTDAEGDVDDIRARLRIDGEEDLGVKMTLDGSFIDSLSLPAISLGRDRNVNIALEKQGDIRRVVFSADQFDAEKVFLTGNTDVVLPPSEFEFLPFLGPNAVVEGRIQKVVGGHDTHVDDAKVHLVIQAGLHEKLRLDGTFQDGTPIVGSIDRATPIRRNFSLKSENAGHILRMFDLQDGIYGGVMEAQGSLYDLRMDEKARAREIGGRITAVGFRARKVPVVASILSLASLTGISDTLTGDGIKFRKLESDFSINDERLTIEGGLVHGAAVGFTVQGDYQLEGDKVDFGGTVIPAYSLNSLPGKIPLLGRLLGGRRGEGLIGIGYRVGGTLDDLDVLVNPLSVLTPGVFRRIFEFGIGLPDSDEVEILEPPREQLTE
jgi:hypothetical protein